jgi:hypothetical protein
MSHSAPPAGGRRNDPTRGGRLWSGVIAFAALLMMFLGAVHVFSGFVALFEDEHYVVNSSGLFVTVDYSVWGVVHIALGVLMVTAGSALFFRRMWARVVTILVAFVSALVNWAFLPAYPVWYTLMIGLDVLIIWAVTVHGDEAGWDEF